MSSPDTKVGWFERALAVVYATIAVLGFIVVVLTLSLYTPVT